MFTVGSIAQYASKGTRRARFTQRPYLIAITRAFRTTATESLLVLAKALPLDLRVAELTSKRYQQMKHSAFSATSRKWLFDKVPGLGDLFEQISPVNSSARLASPNSQHTTAAAHAENTTTITKRLIRNASDMEWKTCSRGTTTRLFFPETQLPTNLNIASLSNQVTQILTGHSLLMCHQFRFGFASSAVCNCGHDSETIPHFLFDCPLFASARTAFRIACLNMQRPKRMKSRIEE